MYDIEIKHLKLVKTISETGNLTRASALLHISQPALSRQLKDIEERLGIPLFERTRKKMVLTRMGEEMNRSAGVILNELRRVEQEAVKYLHGDTGQLNIGIHCILSYQWVTRMLKAFTDIYPNVDISIGNSAAMISDLKTGEKDLIISALPYEHRAISQIPVFEDEILAIMPKGHRLSKKKHLVESDFNNETLISFTEASNDGILQFYLFPAGVKLKSFFTVTQPEGIFELIRSGMGVGFFPRWAVHTYLDDGTFTGIPFLKKGLRLQWTASLLKERTRPAYLNYFISMLPDFTPVS